MLIANGVSEEKILFVNLICCPEGIHALNLVYPKVRIITAAIDGGLNEKKYIIPGLGDFGW